MKKQETENIYAIVLAPMTGTAVALSEVPDPVFADKVLGDGLAIIPENGKIVSPVNGEITTIAETGHAYGFTADNGMEVLVHVGLETVSLKGDCFQIHAKAGDKVKAGDLIAEADLEKIKEAGLNCITQLLRKLKRRNSISTLISFRNSVKF